MQVLCESGGHIPLHRIGELIPAYKEALGGAPLWLAGPMVIDNAASLDSVVNTIGIAAAGACGGDMFASITQAEHYAMPTAGDTADAVRNARVAITALELGRGNTAEIARQEAMSRARRKNAWKTQTEHAMYPDLANQVFLQQDLLTDGKPCTICGSPAVTTAAREVANSLRRLGDLVPVRDWLIVGGSLARGEPSFAHAHSGEPTLLSDIDLLYVHRGERPSTLLREIMNLAETLLPAVELMAMPVRDYQVVATSLGHDFKNIGVPVTRHGLPPHTRVHLDERDAYEILLYHVMCWFWSGLSESWFAGDATAEFHLMVNRLCMKVLRATAMLDGAYRHHDLHMMSPYVAERMRAELAWRTAPLGRPADPGRFWSYLDEAFRRFDARFGRPGRGGVQCLLTDPERSHHRRVPADRATTRPGVGAYLGRHRRPRRCRYGSAECLGSDHRLDRNEPAVGPMAILPSTPHSHPRSSPRQVK
ncbi:phosphomethylpyrimidine synthase ThiC [Nocardia sp. CNY236]|uniref:phosphomethylpyrimidine synthase ThiC n=1 Tax=Nocardia sp. CNY236 TaxID=1169152 RepID=UPI000402D507|nr:phosphomethylpyrimidine synthase ThiC [Nocardia sp. CNY236]